MRVLVLLAVTLCPSIRGQSVWAPTEEARLVGAGPVFADLFAGSVSLSGDTAVGGVTGRDHSGFGGAGAAFVFVRSGASWKQAAMLVPGDPFHALAFGWSVALSSDSALLVGAWQASTPAQSRPGAAYVFASRGKGWSQEAKLVASQPDHGDYFGVETALHGDAAFISATREDQRATNSLGDQGRRGGTRSVDKPGE